MEKKYSVYTQDDNKQEHSLITDCSAEEASEFIKMVLKKKDPNKPVDFAIRPYIKV